MLPTMVATPRPSLRGIPRAQRWLFWEVDVSRLDVDRDADSILARILEHGRMVDVRWVLRRYGNERIHRFFREVGHPELTPRTLAFWRAYFKAENETWASPPAWRQSNSAPWID